MKLSEIKPYVRFSRYCGGRDEYRHFNYPLYACDCRLLYCVDGSGKIVIGGDEYEVKCGTLLLWREGVPYTYLPSEKDAMLLLGVNFDYTWEHSNIMLPLPPKQSKSSDEYFAVEAPIFEDCEAFNGVVVVQNVRESFYARLLEINREFAKKKNRYELKCSGILTQMLAEIASRTESVQTAESEKLADSVIDYLNGHYGENLSIGELGALFGYHPNYLNQLFIKYTGRSLYAYLQDLRIMQAIRLLESSDMSIEDVGISCGFQDRSHFSKYFKQKTGRSPKAFRA